MKYSPKIAFRLEWSLYDKDMARLTTTTLTLVSYTGFRVMPECAGGMS